MPELQILQKHPNLFASFLTQFFAPVTLSPRYFSVPLYWSPNLFKYSQQNTGKHYKQTRMMDATY